MFSRLLSYRHLSAVTLAALSLFIILLSIFVGPPLPLSWDTIGYYSYLTELFTDGSIHIENLSYYEHIVDTYDNSNTLYQFITLENGAIITKYTSGWSIVNSPFMLIAHLFAGWFGYAQDGYSDPYQIALFVSSLFYTLLGLIVMRKVLLHFFSDKLTALLLVILVLGTNYLHTNYSCIGTVHVYLFPLYALLLLFTIKFHQNKRIKYSIILGVILGLMMLIRPTEIIAILIPLLYGINSFKSFLLRFKQYFKSPYYYALSLTIIGIYGIQMLFWYKTTGSPLVYTYLNPAEGLDFDKPHLLEVLFSFRKGWLIYTPIMIFVLIGIYRSYKLKNQLYFSFSIFLILYLYVTSCWTSWWYAGSFSLRQLEHIYPICLLLIGFSIYQLKPAIQKFNLSVIGIFILLNLFQTWQFQNGILHMSRMSSAYYFSIFGQTSAPTEKQKSLLLIDRSLENFENKSAYKLVKQIESPFNNLVLSQENPYSPAIKFSYNDISEQDHLWLIATSEIEQIDSNSTIPDLHLCIYTTNEHGVYNWRKKSLAEFYNTKGNISFEYLTPHLRSEKDTIAVSLWHQNGEAVQAKNLELFVYEKK
ncbi:glycosyltransferase family 39 protein [Paracrocinitomix mangrovi]|uniref:glycosyltransferase family 39 protein n=1 Tax=Paracrocinitomix mangrovi TaxID=2862509 RepID=UPI001C8E3CEF|nr:glycosyltransferase family 39 protein [Paracrocinitomix mangrovi]UKN03639.1 glycosyltransferase family 39 protein [Paracrocinitomix mangrovi]